MCHSPPLYLGRPSWSTPLTTNLQVAAAIISLLNDYLLSTGRRSPGFLLNPSLYGRGSEDFKDTTEGSDRATTWMDSPPSMDGILCVQPNLFPLNFRRWVALSSASLGPRDPFLPGTAGGA